MDSPYDIFRVQSITEADSFSDYTSFCVPFIIPQYLPTRCFPVGLCERWCLHCASAYNPKQLEGSNVNSKYKIVQPLLQNVLHVVECHLDLCRAAN
jgi:hypothetical protein